MSTSDFATMRELEADLDGRGLVGVIEKRSAYERAYVGYRDGKFTYEESDGFVTTALKIKGVA